MKAISPKILLAGLLTTSALALAREIPTTDVNKVFNSGNTIRTSAPVNLQPGLFVMGPIDGDSKKVTGTHYLLIDRYTNSEDQFIGVMISADSLVRGNPSSAFIFRTSTVRKGQTLMLYPLTIDIYGNLSVEAELSRTSPYIEISTQNLNDSHRYPYLVQGKNGLLNDHLMGMRRAGNQWPHWNPWPSSGIYESRGGKSHLVVNGNTLAIHQSGMDSETFAISPINGDDSGKMAGLSESNYDTMSEMDVTDSKFQKLAFFIHDVEQKNIFIIATPKNFPGRYDLKIYAPEEKSFMDRFFPGLL